MSFLCQIALGPVQGFIASARRTRDLWFGSYVLSEISRATAISLVDECKGTLIFPSVPDGLVDHRDQPLTLRSDDFLVVNILLAQLPCNTRDEALACIRTARKAAEKRWQQACDDAQAQVNGVAPARARRRDAATADKFLRDDVWRAQLSDVIEVYAAAVPLKPDGSDYADALGRLKRVLAARKASRVFAPLTESDKAFALPKSSLDGTQSTVIREADGDGALAIARSRRRLGIETGEQLDTAGMVKRVVGRARRFVPVARVAAEPWLANLGPDDQQLLRDAYDATCGDGLDESLGSRLSGAVAADFPWVGRGRDSGFAFDSQLLYPSRIDAALKRLLKDEELAGTPDEARQLEGRADGLKAVLASVTRKYGWPTPYYVLLFADGDRMGELLDGILRHAPVGEAMTRQREVSQALSRFAQGVRALVNMHQGAAIYSGGDDVLALLPLEHAVPCAKALATAFAGALSAIATRSKVSVAPSLSVGLAIAHFLDPLGDVRRQAEHALELGKGNRTGVTAENKRNALGIVVKPRGGSAIETRLRWDATAAFTTLVGWTRQLGNPTEADALPNGLPHEVAATLANAVRLFGTEGEAALAPYRAMLRRVLEQKRHPGSQAALTADVQAALLDALTPDGASVAQLNELAQRFVLARWLALRADPEGGRTSL